MTVYRFRMCRQAAKMANAHRAHPQQEPRDIFSTVTRDRDFAAMQF